MPNMVQKVVLFFVLFCAPLYADSPTSYFIKNYYPTYETTDTCIYDSQFVMLNNAGDTPFYLVSAYGMTSAAEGWAIFDTNVEVTTATPTEQARYVFYLSGTTNRIHPVHPFPVALKFNYGLSARTVSNGIILLQVKTIKRSQ